MRLMLWLGWKAPSTVSVLSVCDSVSSASALSPNAIHIHFIGMKTHVILCCQSKHKTTASRLLSLSFFLSYSLTDRHTQILTFANELAHALSLSGFLSLPLSLYLYLSLKHTHTHKLLSSDRSSSAVSLHCIG